MSPLGPLLKCYRQSSIYVLVKSYLRPLSRVDTRCSLADPELAS